LISPQKKMELTGIADFKKKDESDPILANAQDI
jgi:hypothetical protein